METTQVLGIAQLPAAGAYDSGAPSVPIINIGASHEQQDCADGMLRKRDGTCAIEPRKMTVIRFSRGDGNDNRSEIDSAEYEHDSSDPLTSHHLHKSSSNPAGEIGGSLQELLDANHPQLVEIDLPRPEMRANSPISPSVLLAGDVLKLQSGNTAYKVPEGFRPLGRALWSNSFQKRALKENRVEVAPAEYQYYPDSIDSYSSCDDWSDRHKPHCRGRLRRHRFWPLKRDVPEEDGGKGTGRLGGRRGGRNRNRGGRMDDKDGEVNSLAYSNNGNTNDDYSRQGGDDIDRRADEAQGRELSKRSMIIIGNDGALPAKFADTFDRHTHSRYSGDDDRTDSWSDDWDTRTSCDHASDIDKPHCSAEKLRKNMLLSQDAVILKDSGAIIKDHAGNVLVKATNGTSGDSANATSDAASAEEKSKRGTPTPLSSELLKRATADGNVNRALAHDRFMRRWLEGSENPRPFEALEMPKGNILPRGKMDRHELTRRAHGTTLPAPLAGLLKGDPSGPKRQASTRPRQSKQRRGGRLRRKGRTSGIFKRPDVGRRDGGSLMPLAKRQLDPKDNKERQRGVGTRRTGRPLRDGGNRFEDESLNESNASEWTNDGDVDTNGRMRGAHRMQKRGIWNSRLGRHRDGTDRQIDGRFRGQRGDQASTHSASTRQDLRFVCPGGICMRSVEEKRTGLTFPKRDVDHTNDDGPEEASQELETRSHSSGSECHECRHHRHHYWDRSLHRRDNWDDHSEGIPEGGNASVNSALSQVGNQNGQLRAGRGGERANAGGNVGSGRRMVKRAVRA